MSSTVAGASSAGGGKEVVEAGKESGSGSLEGEVNLGGSMTRQVRSFPFAIYLLVPSLVLNH